MKTLYKILRKVWRSNPFCNENGQGLVEYAVILGLIAVITTFGLHSVGERTSQSFDKMNNEYIPGSVSFLGGNLRRRVKTSDPTILVNTSTDIRLTYAIDLPKNAEIRTDGSSYFAWDTGSGNLNKKTNITKLSESNNQLCAALIVSNVPKNAFGAKLHCMSHIEYIINGETKTIESEIGIRSVYDICEKMKTRTDQWGKYAQFLLGEIDTISAPTGWPVINFYY